MSPLRIELVLPSLVQAGMEIITAELGVRLAHRGHDVGVTCIHEAGALEERLSAAGIRVSVVPIPGLGPNFFTARMKQHLRSIAPHIVHSQSGAWLKVALAARRAGVPGVVHTIHGLHDQERARDMLLMFAGSLFTDVVTAVSGPLERYLIERIRIPAAKVRTLLNGVDHMRFSPEGRGFGLREELGLPPEAVLVGIVARFSAVKDHETLLNAFDLIRRRYPYAHLVLIGDGELRTSIEARIKSCDMAARVHLVGSLEDTAPAYRDLDAFVLSSKNEGTSISLLEALASGLPAIATRVGGNPDLVRHGVDGLLVPSGDPEGLADALARIVADPELRASMASAARRHVETELTLAGMVDRYEAIYDELSSASSSTPGPRRPMPTREGERR